MLYMGFITPFLFMLSSIGIRGYLQPSVSAKSIFKTLHSFPLRTLLNSNGISTTSLNAASRKKNNDFIEGDANADNQTKKSLRKIKSFAAKTANQVAYVELMRNDDVDIVIASGPAGTGKTMLACYAAVEALRLGKVHKIVITRPVVSVDEEIGFLPGGLTSKMDPWTRPAFDALKESYTQKEIDTMIDEGVIEIVPLGFMRGRTFKWSWIVADEMQNSTPMQMLMLATRIGEGSKMIITGDLNQSDRVGLNGLQEICEKVRLSNDDNSCIRLITLEPEDVQRSRAAKAVLNIYEPIDVRLALDKPSSPTKSDIPSGSETTNHSNSSPIPFQRDNNSDAALIPLQHITPNRI